MQGLQNVNTRLRESGLPPRVQRKSWVRIYCPRFKPRSHFPWDYDNSCIDPWHLTGRRCFNKWRSEITIFLILSLRWTRKCLIVFFCKFEISVKVQFGEPVGQILVTMTAICVLVSTILLIVLTSARSTDDVYDGRTSRQYQDHKFDTMPVRNTDSFYYFFVSIASLVFINFYWWKRKF